MRSRAIVLIAVMAMMAVGAAPVSAAGPEVNDFELVADGQDCGEGVTYDIDLRGEERAWERTGKVFTKTRILGEAVASNGVVIAIHHNWLDKVDLEANTLTVIGFPFRIWVVGGHERTVDWGVIKLDLDTDEVLFEAGSHDNFFDFNPHHLTCDLIFEAASG